MLTHTVISDIIVYKTLSCVTKIKNNIRAMEKWNYLLSNL